jgi:ribosomal protein S27AE
MKMEPGKLYPVDDEAIPRYEDARQTSQKLPPYRSTECCPKCGGRDFSDRWVPGDTTVTQLGVGEGRIERTCTNCGYVIKEAPNDAS